MELYPAIDLRGGRVVRLRQGQADAETRYGDDPLARVEEFTSAGFSYLHIVDLDAALARQADAATGTATGGENRQQILQILRNTSLPVQLGGGIRSERVAETWLEAGVQRLLLSTVVIREPEVFARLTKRFGAQIWVSVDLRGVRVADKGWQEESSLTAEDVVRRAEDLGAGGLVRTEILRDGTGSGVDADSAAAFAATTSLPVVVAGGVATLRDLARLRATGKIAGAILGRALYEGTIKPQEAVALRNSWHQEDGQK